MFLSYCKFKSCFQLFVTWSELSVWGKEEENSEIYEMLLCHYKKEFHLIILYPSHIIIIVKYSKGNPFGSESYKLLGLQGDITLQESGKKNNQSSSSELAHNLKAQTSFG